METADLFESNKVLFYFSQFWSFLTVSLTTYLVCVAWRQLVRIRVPTGFGPAGNVLKEKDSPSDLPVWFQMWRATLELHGALIASVAGLTPLPAPDWVPDEWFARVTWFGLAGVVSAWTYAVAQRLFSILASAVANVLPAFLRQKLGVAEPQAATAEAVIPSTNPPPADAGGGDPGAIPKD